MINRLRSTYKEFPRSFWVLAGSGFIDRLGATLVFPFFSLYITQKFEVGMTQAGVLLAIFSITGLAGSMIGGALTDRFGRRFLVLFGLIISALSSVLMGLVNDLSVFYLLAGFAGLLSDMGGPARQAMVADLLPEKKRSEGFGILRVAGNMAWIIGPTIGGLLAARSYLLLFVLDAISSTIVAVILYLEVPETMPSIESDGEETHFIDTIKGYRVVAADGLFLSFVLTTMLMSVVYLQMYSTLSVYLRDVHGVPARGFGALLSMNAATVVLLQFWITRKVRPYPQMLIMALGTGLYLVGFTAYGFVSSYVLFAAAMLVITFGEMLIIPVGQSLAARFAPEAMRGRYMAFFGLSWAIPNTIGPYTAGLVMDHFDPRWVWYAAGILSALAVLGYLTLYLRTRTRFAEQDQVF
ncbi:MAG: MFS transporter, partial [Anaerolineales bacterium]